MSFGQNFYDWLLGNAQPLILAAIVIIAVYLGYKRELTKMIGFLVIAIIVVVMVYNTAGVKDLLLELGNKILGLGNDSKDISEQRTGCNATVPGIMYSARIFFTSGIGIHSLL